MSALAVAVLVATGATACGGEEGAVTPAPTADPTVGPSAGPSTAADCAGPSVVDVGGHGTDGAWDGVVHRSSSIRGVITVKPGGARITAVTLLVAEEHEVDLSDDFATPLAKAPARVTGASPSRVTAEAQLEFAAGRPGSYPVLVHVDYESGAGCDEQGEGATEDSVGVVTVE